MADPNKLIPYKKCCEIKDGKFVRMFWEHPSHVEEIELDPVLTRWRELAPQAMYTSAQFLDAMGFRNENVIRDGNRPPPR
jgi:hypothetical protein